jgi:hypothetical protein
MAKRRPVNLEDARRGDTLHLRCGGKVILRKIWDTQSDTYPVGIQIEGYHAGTKCWLFTNDGQNGDATGPDADNAPFDIVAVTMKQNRRP